MADKYGSDYITIVDEDGEIILCAIEDEQELETVYNLMMDALYEEEEDEDED